MFPAEQETEHKFWTIPEMIAKLLPFLGLKSTLCLVQVHEENLNSESCHTFISRLSKSFHQDLKLKATV